MAEVEVEYRPTHCWALIKMRSIEKPEYFEGPDLSVSIDDDHALTVTTYDGSVWAKVRPDVYEWFKLFRSSTTVKAEPNVNPKGERMTDYKRSKRT